MFDRAMIGRCVVAADARITGRNSIGGTITKQAQASHGLTKASGTDAT
jgi:hypothetical protein